MLVVATQNRLLLLQIACCCFKVRVCSRKHARCSDNCFCGLLLLMHLWKTGLLRQNVSATKISLVFVAAKLVAENKQKQNKKKQKNVLRPPTAFNSALFVLETYFVTVHGRLDIELL